MEKAQLVEKITNEVLKRIKAQSNVPSTVVGVSNRHMHVSKADLECLFGKGYELTKWKDLKQPGQFAAKETVTIVGPKGAIEKVRILGPVRNRTQVEISKTDSFTLGIKAPIRESGNIKDTPGVMIKGPKQSIRLHEGVIIAKRHIHMSPSFAKQHGFHDKELVKVQFNGERGLVFNEVLLRVSEKFVNEMHIDTDEANAGNIGNGDVGIILKG